MSGLLFLSAADFNLKRGTKGGIMCTRIRGVSLVLFYSTKCRHCQSLIPIFKKLPGTIAECQFAMINISQNKQCIQMSQQTIAPIEIVPYMLLYINGKPYMRYNGPHDTSEIGRFIIEVTNNLRRKQDFTKNVNVKQETKNSIPAYTIGHPLCGPDDKICYLKNIEAYDTVAANNNSAKQRIRLPAGAGMSGGPRR